MKKVLKWIGIILGSILTLIVVAAAALYLIGNSRIANAQVEPRRLTVSVEEASLERGEHLVRYVAACISCHGQDLGGDMFLEDPMMGSMAAPNLTSGAGGTNGFSVEDWDLAIRHGVGKDGRVLGGMPSQAYAYMSDSDLAAVIAYLQSVPPVDRVLPERSFSLAGTIIFGGLGLAGLPYELIDHASVGSSQPALDISVDYGAYLATLASCADCHGDNLAGRPAESNQPGPPPGPNITSTGSIGNWTAEEFMTVMRAGRTPDGRQISQDMPWRYYAGMTDDELESIYLYLRQLP
jgi:mono/diheme cytochrome c family protein